MPKKIHTNPKADAARERKEEVKQAKKAAAEQAAEREKWADEGSTAAEQRRREKAAREAEEARKRAERKALIEKDEAEAAKLNNRAKGLSNAEKITRAALAKQREQVEAQRRAEAEAKRLAALKLVAQPEPSPNVNKAVEEQHQADIDEYGAENVIDASGVDDALDALGGGALNPAPAPAAAAAAPPAKAANAKDDTIAFDLHPEKRMRSAHQDFEERMLPKMREEHPHLKLSQYKQMIFKLWQKSPENPKIMRAAAEKALLQETDAYKYGDAWRYGPRPGDDKDEE